uniref:Aquaporin 4 n=1 Tax=Callorhinchus milii TaxID=7868 RepID=A0A4W3GSL3_CALMI
WCWLPTNTQKCSQLCNCETIMTAFKGIWTQPFWKAVSAEFLAMLIFVLLSLGSTIRWNGKDQPMDLVLVSLCFGLSIATMVQCFGHISGGHVNPAVTAAMVCTRKLSLAKGLFYVVAQCLGAITGAGILYLITPSSVAGGLGVTKVNKQLSAGHGLLVEIFITFQLVLTIFATCDPKREDLKGSSALAIGFSVAIGHMFAIYWVGPLIGGIVAAALYDYLFCPDKALKDPFKDVFKSTQPPGGKYVEVEENNRTQFIESEDPGVKPVTSQVIDIDQSEEKKEKDSTNELLSSV